MRHRVIAAGAVLTFGFSTRTLAAQIEIQGFVGSAESASLPITVSQAGEPDIHFTANWATRPTTGARYYAVRLGIWKGNRGWRLDHTHHKLYLTNPPAEIQDFRITNGFNIFSLSRAFRRDRLTYSLGAGPVITYPISKVRGQRLNEDLGLSGYHVDGASLLGTVTREFPIVAGLFVSIDARASASYVRIPIANGHAKIPNAALHLHGGIGYSFGSKRKK